MRPFKFFYSVMSFADGQWDEVNKCRAVDGVLYILWGHSSRRREILEEGTFYIIPVVDVIT
jgi:hypothetical protein